MSLMKNGFLRPKDSDFNLSDPLKHFVHSRHSFKKVIN